MSLDRRFAEAMGQLLGPDFPSDIGLAVSGGGDSMAMLTLAHNWTRVWGVRLWVVTVDHGLRPEAASEAALVADECAALGWPHATLRWHWDRQGNLQDAARRGRLETIARWRGALRHVLMAHTSDDLAETFVMRLARGSGVEGLSAMAPVRRVTPPAQPAPEDYDGTLPPRADASDTGFTLVRPCLDMTRGELRHYLRTLHGRWVEDPSNDDPRFGRVRVRRLLALLDAEGIDAATLADTAHRMARARVALAARAVQVWEEIGTEDRRTGDLLFDRAGFDRVERDTQLRLLAAALRWVASAAYRPRVAPLKDLLDRLLGGGGGTLHGCEARAGRDSIRVFREYAALSAAPATAGATWDTRWTLADTLPGGLRIAPLGEAGWMQAVPRPDDAPPFHAARSLPALWQGEALFACDALDFGPGATVRPTAPPFGQFLLSH